MSIDMRLIETTHKNSRLLINPTPIKSFKSISGAIENKILSSTSKLEIFSSSITSRFNCIRITFKPRRPIRSKTPTSESSTVTPRSLTIAL